MSGATVYRIWMSENCIVFHFGWYKKKYEMLFSEFFTLMSDKAR